MELTWGVPLWPSLSPAGGPWAPLQTDCRCDVLVVGAGISGALIADGLLRVGLDVMTIDKRAPGSGSTGASTSLLLYELDTPLRELVRMYGLSRATRAYRLGVEAISEIERLVGELGDDCGFRRKKSLYLASHGEDVRGLRAECELRREAGLRVELLDEGDIARRFSFKRAAALLSFEAAEVDPYRLTRRVIDRAVSGGMRLYGGTEAAGYEITPDGVRLRTRHGPRITARKIVYATGYEAAGMLGPGLAHAQVSYATASEPLGAFTGWWEQCMIWETARPYLYLRTTADGRAIIGGEDDPDLAHLGDTSRLEQKRQKLGRRFGDLFPRIPFEPAASWAGVFETTPDGLPYIGTHAKFPHALFGLGYGGNGITFSIIAAEVLRDAVLGKPNPDAEIFRFDRAPAADAAR